jgi:hypothetical protein
MAADSTPIPAILSQQLLSVTEDLKLPLIRIARQAEQAGLTGQADLKKIQATAETALNLLDGYNLGVRLTLQPDIAHEAVSIASILYDTGQQLDDLAKSYGVALELDIAGRFEPVLAHRQGLQAALASLGAALIEALPAQESAQLKLRLATHRSRYGVVAGVYADTRQLMSGALKRGRELQRRSRQPLVTITHTSGAGIFVADAILNAMNLSLKTSRHHNLYGLGTVLQPNNQLRLV